jgi:hypothetical protein
MNARKSLKSLLAVLLVAVLSVLGMGIASADDGGLNNWTNSTRNQAGQPSLPSHAGLSSAAQSMADAMASSDSMLPFDASKVPAGYSGYKPFLGKSSSPTAMHQKWIQQGYGSFMVSNWSHIGSGVATSKTGSVYAVQILATYPAPAPVQVAPVPAPAPAPVVIPAPAPVVEQPAPAPAPVQEPLVEAPAPAPVEAPKETPVVTPTPTVEPTPSVSATPTPEPTATETQAVAEPTETAVPLDGSQTGQATPLSKETAKAGVGGFGILFALFAGFSFLRAAQHRKVANSVFTPAA